jgi:two-component system, OmpR family, response regulator
VGIGGADPVPVDSYDTAGTRVLVVRDDAALSASVTHELQRAGHLVEHADGAAAGLSMATSGAYDVIVLSRKQPGGVDAVQLLRTYRIHDDRTPVLLVSATADVDGLLQSFHAGADDVLVPPFLLTELRLRVRVLARRRAERPCTRLRVADLTLDVLSRRVCRAGLRVALTPREFRLLECLMRHPGQVLTSSALLQQAWDSEDRVRLNTVRAYISRLRLKVDEPFSVPLIRTASGGGYALQGTPYAVA